MLTLLAVALTAVPAPQLATIPFRTVELSAARGESFAEYLATRLVEAGVRVTTPRDLDAVLGLDRQRQLLACGDGTSCLAELAGALGVPEVVTGEVAKLDSGYQLVVKVLDARSARVRFARAAHLDSERALFSTLDAWALEIAGQRPARTLAPLVPLGLGLVAAGVGVGFVVSANQSLGALQRRGDAALTYDAAVVARANGTRDQVVGLASVGVGAAAMLAGLTWFLVSAPKEAPTALLVPTPGGLALVGVWP